jgi:hypothetical protein
MFWLFIIAGVMAVFGLLGYLRGWHAALFILIMTFLAVVITGRLGDVIIRYINAFCKGFKFLLSGGLAALTGEGGAEAAFQALGDMPPCIDESNESLVLGLIFVTMVFFAVLLSGMNWLESPQSLFGLFLGLMAGYLVAAVIVRVVAPEYAVFVPLPFGLGASTVPCCVVVPPGGGGTSLVSRVLEFLTSLVDRGLIAVFLGVVIAVFVLLAARPGSHGSGKE